MVLFPLLLNAAARVRGSWRSSLSGAHRESAGLHSWVLRHQLDGVVQVRGREHQDAAQLLFRLGIRTIGDGHLAMLPSQGGSALSGVETFPASTVTVLPQHVIVGEACVHLCVPLAVGQRVPLLLIQVSKTSDFKVARFM